MQVVIDHVNIQAELSRAGGMDIEQFLITKTLDEATRMTRLKIRV